MEQARLALATILSDHSIRMVSDSRWIRGDHLTLDLCIPTATLPLSGTVSAALPRDDTSLFDIVVELDPLTPEQHLEFIRYTFEDVTNDIHFPQILEQEDKLKPIISSRNHRQSHRTLTSAPIDLMIKSLNRQKIETLSGVVLDCSSANARVETKLPLEVGGWIELNAPWYENSVMARVVRCIRNDSIFSPVYTVAVEFEFEHVLFARRASEWGKRESFALFKLMPLQKVFLTTLLLIIAGILYPYSARASGELTLTPTYFSSSGHFHPTRVSLFVEERILQSKWSYSSWTGLGRTMIANTGNTVTVGSAFTEWVTTQQDLSYLWTDRVKCGAGFGYSAVTSGLNRQYDFHVNLAVRLW